MSKKYNLLKLKVLEKSKFRCHYCHEQGDTLDHKIAESNGGKTEEKNLLCACNYCNVLKGHKSYEEFQEYIQTIGLEQHLNNKRDWERKNNIKTEPFEKIKERLNPIITCRSCYLELPIIDEGTYFCFTCFTIHKMKHFFKKKRTCFICGMRARFSYLKRSSSKRNFKVKVEDIRFVCVECIRGMNPEELKRNAYLYEHKK